MKKEVITDRNPKSPVSEVFRSLRTNIQYLKSSDKGAQSIVITSTVQGEGKSWVTANLSVTFAQAGKNVVLIDSDMRRPRQNTIFGTGMFPGLSNYLSSIDENGKQRNISIRECVKSTEVENLYLIPAGNIPPNPSELLTSSKMMKFLDELKKIFDVIIFDAAPCLVVTDATIIGRLVDSTILVAASSKTRIDDIQEAKRRVEHVGGKIAGVVLNRVKQSGKKYGYSYNYRYYYTSSGEKTKKGVEHTDIAQMKIAKNDRKKSKFKNQKYKDRDYKDFSSYSKANRFDSSSDDRKEKQDRQDRKEKNENENNKRKNEDKEENKTENRFNEDAKENRDDNSNENNSKYKKDKNQEYSKDDISSERINNILDEIKNYGGEKND